MRKLLLCGVLSGLSALSMSAATTPLYINNSPLFAPPALPPQIDATAFHNGSTFDVNSFFGGFIFIVGDTAVFSGANFDPYEMMNTRFVTNAPGATMSGSPGFRFDYFSAANNARLAQTVWENRGLITVDPLLRVMATNILNRGALEATEAGLIKLQGTNVDVSRSSFRVGTGPNTPPPGGGDIFGTNHFNAAGVADLYWGAGINNRVTNEAPNMRLDVPGFTNLLSISSPPHQVVRRVGNGLATNLMTLSAAGFTNYVYTNQTGPDTFQYQVVFVGPTGDSNITSNVEFFVPGDNGGANVLVSFESADPDIITGDFVTNGVYLIDYSAFTTNIGVTWNGFTGPFRTRRPNTYEFFRSRPFFFIATPTNANGTFTETSLYDTNMATNFVLSAYAAYGASFGSSATNIATPPGVLIPPPGRVEINGDRVNLNRTRIRAENTVIIKARDVSSNAVMTVDAPFLEFDIASSAPPLVIRQFTPPSVRRFAGQIQAWSGVWQNTNTVSMVDTNGMTNTVSTVTDYHVLIVRPTFNSVVFVTVNDLLLAAEQVEIADTLSVSRRFRIDARDWTITESGILSLPFMYGLGPSNMIDLVNFTNRGILSVSGLAEFGTEEDPLVNYVIAPGGNFLAAGHFISAESVQIGGALTATAGGINIRSDSVNLSGNLASTSDIDIRAPVIVASNSFISAGSLGAPASLIFEASDIFVDAGIGAPNDWTAFGGIQVLSLPGTGDLLGTTVRVPRPNFGEALIVWPSADFGASAGGFNNNLALGTLVLDGGVFSLFRFEGVQEPGAIYINRLELNGEPAADPANAIQIEPGMTVYFADSNVDPTTLDGLHGGRLRWVQDFAGPLNSTNIVYPSGQTYTFNTALIRSTTLDSDGDGIVNALDSTPVIVGDRIDLKIAASRGSTTRKTVISWMAPGNSTSVVEYKDSLQGNWQALPAVQNPGAAQRLSISEDLPATSSQRFYRVRTE